MATGAASSPCRSRESALQNQQRFHARRPARGSAGTRAAPADPLRAAPRGRALPHKGRPRPPPRSGHVRSGGTDKARTCCASSPGRRSSAPPGLPREAGTPGHRATPRPGRPTPDGAGHPRPPGNKARPGRRACAVLGAGAAAREEPLRARTHRAAALRVPGRAGQTRGGVGSRPLRPGCGGRPDEGSDPSPVGKETAATGRRPASARAWAPACGTRKRPPLSLRRSPRGSCAGSGPAGRRQREAPPRRETMRGRRPARGCRAAGLQPAPPSWGPGSCRARRRRDGAARAPAAALL